MKNKYLRLKAGLLALAITVTSVSLSSCTKREYDGNEMVASDNLNLEKKVFGVGEHIISVPIKDPSTEIMQYNYHEGYKAIGIASSSMAYTFSGACILFENEYPVECYSDTKDKNGNSVFNTFGKPIDFNRAETEITEDTKVFNAGEHIISVPAKDPTDDVIQYEYHEGYEVVGIASFDLAYSFDGACLLYVNNKPVRCTLTQKKNEKDCYLSFGTPLEKDVARTLTN